jgi:hypothetical protein
MQYPEAMTRVMKNRKAAISQPMMIPNPNNPDALFEAELWCEYYNNFIAPGESCMEPMISMYYPIINSVNQVDISTEENYPDDYEVEAMVAVDMYWRSLIKDILPPGSRGIIMVVENTCVPDSFTYQINGPNVKYVGVGDYHDSEYDGISASSRMVDLYSYMEGESDYTGIHIDHDACIYTLHVYPSDEMKGSKCITKSDVTISHLKSHQILYTFPSVRVK